MAGEGESASLPLGRRDCLRPRSLKPAKTVTSRIQCEILPTVGTAKRAGSASVFPRSPSNGLVKVPGEVEWRPTGQVEAKGFRRVSQKSQIAGGVIPVDFSPSGRVKH